MAIRHTIMRTTLALVLANIYVTDYAQAQNKPPMDEFVPSQVAQSLKEAAQKAVLNSPEVLARWHAFRAATEEVGVARGGFLPKIDAGAGIGRERISQPGSSTLDYRRHGYNLTLGQMLFDGFATSNEVKQLGRAKLVRYFELLDTSETIALGAAGAYLDVLRYRELAQLAEQNYTEHKSAHEQLKQRFDSGVGKRVDVDQAASRLALADVNLTTTYANLHDVTARYLRIVGEQPGKALPHPDKTTAQDLPVSVEGALRVGLKTNPALRAAVENIESSQYDLSARRAAFSPRVDLKAYNQIDNNYFGTPGNRRDTAVELVLNYNIFSGGSDAARNRQYRERKNIALDEREKACRDMRQTLSIAYNDVLRLREQLGYIAIQVDLVDKTRTAYQDQFKIGQRTLLDLLNTQNEYFDARRAQVNGENDLTLAYLRTYAGMGHLLENLGLKQLESENNPDERDLTEVDMALLCPPTSPEGTQADRGMLTPKAPVATVQSLPPVIQMPAEPAGNAPDVSKRVEDWRAAWVSRSTQNYLPFYSANFIPEGTTPHTETGYVPDGSKQRAAWEQQRRQRLAGAIGIAVDIQNLVVHMTGTDTAVAEFRQIYHSDSHSDTVNKSLDWRKEDGVWKIVREYIR